MEKETKNSQEPKFEITKDNILHYFMHAATREDIAELRAENKANIGELRAETKNSIDGLRSEIKADIDKLDNKIERIADKIDVKFTSMDGKFSSLSDKLDKKLNKHFMWLVGLMFSGFAGTMVFIVKYLPMVVNK